LPVVMGWTTGFNSKDGASRQGVHNRGFSPGAMRPCFETDNLIMISRIEDCGELHLYYPFSSFTV
jgi:hypothetical protein